MKRLGFLVLLALGLAMAAPVWAAQEGSLAAGTSVTVDTAKDDLTEITLKNESNQEIVVEATGATTRTFKVGPVQTVGTLGKFNGAKLTLTNKGPGPVAYKVSW